MSTQLHRRRANVALKQILRKFNSQTEYRSHWQHAATTTVPSTHILVDGWLSDSGDDHLHEHYMAATADLDPTRTQRLASFSYYGPADADMEYRALDTCLSVRRYAQKLADLINAAQSDTTVVTGYSMGALVTLLAASRIADQHTPLTQERLPLIVLLAPPLDGSRVIWDIATSTNYKHNPLSRIYDRLYDQLTPSSLVFDGESGSSFGIPPVVAQVAPSNSPLLREVRDAIPNILAAGVTIMLLCSPYDKFADYSIPSDPRLYYVEIPTEWFDIKKPVQLHFDLKRDSRVMKLIYLLTRPNVPLEP